MERFWNPAALLLAIGRADGFQEIPSLMSDRFISLLADLQRFGGVRRLASAHRSMNSP
ncbi:MAG TPA: hypothetical protein G4O11_10935 [Anaerolineae bacterium]|nr:hypothetical protein [Anaerolineae bacterium]